MSDFFYNYTFPGEDHISKLAGELYDDPKTNNTKTSFIGIIYDAAIIDKCLDSFEDAVISPLHAADDEHTKPHWHIIVNLGRNGQRYKSMLNLFHGLGIIGCKAVVNKTAMIRYLAHRSSSSGHKEQFSDEVIKEQLRCSDPDKFNSYFKLITGVDTVLSDYDKIFQTIVYNEKRFIYYVDLLEYLRQTDSSLYVFACRNSNFCLKLLKSQEFKNKKLEEFK